MRFVRKNPARVLLLLGSVLVITSVLWEYARMHPDYRFLVEPWAIRGYDTTQGKVIAVLGIGLLIMAVIVFTEWMTDKAWLGAALGVGAWAGAIAIAAIAAPDEVEVKLGAVAGLALALAAAWVAMKFIVNVAGKESDTLQRKWVQWLIVAGLIAVFYLVIVGPFVVDEPLGLNLAIVVALLLAPSTILAIISPPRELTANRILINATVGVWIVVSTSGGAIRSTLLRLQLEELGVSAQYKDAQITSGLIIAWLGCLLVFVGGVALWARRRDAIAAMKRAAQQRAAAQESVAELEGHST